MLKTGVNLLFFCKANAQNPDMGKESEVWNRHLSSFLNWLTMKNLQNVSSLKEDKISLAVNVFNDMHTDGNLHMETHSFQSPTNLWYL